jgi:hypothetical protein
MGGRSGQAVRQGRTATADATRVSLEDYIATWRNPNYKASGFFISKNPEFSEDYNVLTINAYTGNAYQVNRKIFENTLNDVDRQYVKNLDKALEALPKFKGTTFRGIRDPQGTKLENIRKSVGGTLEWVAFSSTSKDIGRAEKFAGPGGIIFNIKGKSGRDVIKYSSLDYEQEVLFKRNTKFKINKIIGRTVYLTEI